MKIIKLNWNPTEQQLQQFGVIALIALPTIGWAWGASTAVWNTLLGVGFVLATLGLTLPKLLKPVFVGLSLITVPLGLVVSEIILLLMYAIVFAPIGFIFRISKRDSLNLRPVQVASYWAKKPQPKKVSSYYHQW